MQRQSQLQTVLCVANAADGELSKLAAGIVLVVNSNDVPLSGWKLSMVNFNDHVVTRRFDARIADETLAQTLVDAIHEMPHNDKWAQSVGRNYIRCRVQAASKATLCRAHTTNSKLSKLADRIVLVANSQDV